MVISKAISVATAAKRLGCSPRTVYALCQSGKLPCIRLGRRITIPEYVIDDIFRTGRLPSTGQNDRQQARRGSPVFSAQSEASPVTSLRRRRMIRIKSPLN